MAERELRCNRCGRYVPLSTLKYEKTGTHLVCDECRGKKKVVESARIKPLITSPFGGAKIYKYQCTNCRYVFRRSATSEQRKCPSCGGTKLLRYEKLSADDILKMTDDERFSRL